MKVRHTVDAVQVKPRVKRAVIATTLAAATFTGAALVPTHVVTSGIKMIHDTAKVPAAVK